MTARLSAIKIIFLIAILFAACLNNSFAQNTWTQKADVGGGARSLAVGFCIGSKDTWEPTCSNYPYWLKDM
jgi:hypothetical protein